jgi:hypothetical protein
MPNQTAIKPYTLGDMLKVISEDTDILSTEQLEAFERICPELMGVPVEADYEHPEFNQMMEFAIDSSKIRVDSKKQQFLTMELTEG